MNLKAELQELLALEDQNSLFLSVYLNTSVNREGQRTFPVFFRKRVAVLAKLQEHQGGEQRLREFRGNVRRIDRFLSHELTKEARGVAIFCGDSRGFFKALQLPVAVRNKFTVSTSPNLEVLIELSEENRHYCVAVVDQHSGKIFSVYLTDIVNSREIFDDNVPGRTKVGGWSQMRYHRHRKDHIQHFMRDFSGQLQDFFRREQPSALVLLGTQSNLSEFRRYLSTDLSNRILLARSTPDHRDESELIDQVQQFIAEAEQQADRKSINQLYDRLSQDYLAVVGLDETLFSLQMGQLEKLFVSTDLQGQGYRCTHCGFLFSRKAPSCHYCQGTLEPVELRNRMEKLAEHHDVDIDVVAEQTFLDSLGGVAGLLRF